MSNKLTALPADVDSVLKDLAQGFENQDGDSFDYNDIIKFADNASKADVIVVRANIANLADLDFMYDEDNEAYEIAETILKQIKEVS